MRMTKEPREGAAPSTHPQRCELDEGWRLFKESDLPNISNSDDVDMAAGTAASSGLLTDIGVAVPHMPATVLAALADAGEYPDLYHGDNLSKVDPELWKSNWWYQRDLDVPRGHSRYTLTFNGINYRGEVWVNGVKVADQDELVGMIRRHEINITEAVRPGEKNTLAVRIIPEQNTPGLVLGDSPHEPSPEGVDLSDTWADWLNFNHFGDAKKFASYVPDKNAGLWRRVFFSYGGPVALANPYVTTSLPLPRLDEATCTVYVDARNYSSSAVECEVTATITREGKEPIRVSQAVKFEGGQQQEVVFSVEDYPALKIENPELWWPYIWGEPNLYDLDVEASVDGAVSDTAGLEFGIREVTAHRDQTALFPEFPNPGAFYLKVNGRDYLVRGGAYGPDLLLRGDRERAKKIMRYAKDLGINMMRWEGKFVDDDMLVLADREGMPTMHGLMCCGSWEQWSLWNEEDRNVARETLTSVTREMRAHPSTFLWANGSDGLPPDDLLAEYNGALKAAHWQNPVVDTVSARFRDWDGIHMIGPYSWRAPALWFNPDIPNHRGSVAEEGNDETIPTLESIKKFIPEDKLWPISDVWEMHACAVPSMRKLEGIRGALGARYGEVTGVEDLTRKAQVAQYENVRAQFEAYGARGWETHKFTIYWMLNSHWPSFFGHIFDHYFKQGGGYFGAKKALTPISVVFDSYGAGDHQKAQVYFVNQGTDPLADVTVEARIYDLGGKLVDQVTGHVDSSLPHSSTEVFALDRYDEVGSAFFVRLNAKDSAGKELVENTYWQSATDDLPDDGSTSIVDAMMVKQSQWADLSALDQLPAIGLSGSLIEMAEDESLRNFEVTLRNDTDSVAFFVRASLSLEPGGLEILPITYSDNYVTLFPGETRVLTAQIAASDLDGVDPVLEVEGYNVPRQEIA